MIGPWCRSLHTWLRSGPRRRPAARRLSWASGAGAATVGYLTDAATGRRPPTASCTGACVAFAGGCVGRADRTPWRPSTSSKTSPAWHGPTVEIGNSAASWTGRRWSCRGGRVRAGEEILACLERVAGRVACAWSPWGSRCSRVAPRRVARNRGALRRQDRTSSSWTGRRARAASRTLERRFVGSCAAFAARRPGPVPASEPPTPGAGGAVCAARCTRGDTPRATNWQFHAARRRNAMERGGQRRHYPVVPQSRRRPRPSTAPTGTAEILTGAVRLDGPAGRRDSLEYGGGRTVGEHSPYCDTTNAGVGPDLLRGPDQRDCRQASWRSAAGARPPSGRTVVNGVTFDSFTHGFVVLNTTAEAGPDVPDVAQLLPPGRARGRSRHRARAQRGRGVGRAEQHHVRDLLLRRHAGASRAGTGRPRGHRRSSTRCRAGRPASSP